MKTWCQMILFALALGVAAPGCGTDPEPGTSCSSDDDCASLTCFCRQDPVPGTCSKSCTADTDCAQFGDAYTCREFGSAATCGGGFLKICLRG